MSHYQNQDEVYLKQIFSPIVGFFGYINGLVNRVFRFFVRKRWLFLTLIILGSIGGYLLDLKQGNLVFNNQIMIEPHRNSVRYIYNFIESIRERKKADEYVKSIGLEPDWAKNIKKIKISPVIAVEDIFDHLNEEYNDNDFQNTIQDYSPKELLKEKYTFLYKYHIIEIVFNSEKNYNKKVSEVILNRILTNDYFKKETDLAVEQSRKKISRNQESLKFIDNYLEKLTSQNEKKIDKPDIIMVADESKTPILSGLLKQKASIMYSIAKEERVVNLEDKIFSVVEDDGIIKTKKKIYQRKVIILPFLLCFLASLWFFFSFLLQKPETI